MVSTAFQHIYCTVCAHTQVWVKKRKKYVGFVLLHLHWQYCLCMCARASACVHVGTQVQSGSSVLILRVLTVSIESSWQLKEERKIGKWGGVSMLRPSPPHSSLAEDVWIYSGSTTFERSKWEGSSFLLYVWMPSSGVSLSDAVQLREKERESGLGSHSVPCFYYTCMSLYVQDVLYRWGGLKIADRSWVSLSTYKIMYFVMKVKTGLLYHQTQLTPEHTSGVHWGPLCQCHTLIWK